MRSIRTVFFALTIAALAAVSAEHSMAQPGRPSPCRLGHLASSGSLSLDDFQSTKSSGSPLPSSTATRLAIFLARSPVLQLQVTTPSG